MWNELRDISFKFFGNKFENFLVYFESIKPDLKKADLGLSLAEYVNIIFFVMLATFAIEFPLVVVITSLLFKEALLSFIFSFTLTVFILLGIFFIFYTYPSVITSKKKKNIEGRLAFATTYMATVASSGAPPTTIFKVLSQFKEYGDIANEAERITRDVEVFGLDLATSIRRTASRTPSPQLKELLWGMDNVMTTGGDLGEFLHEKSRTFISEYKRRLQTFSQTLSLLIEVYLTVVLVGSIFFIIMSALMSMFGGGDINLLLSFIQFLIIFVGLPLVSLGFIGLLKMISP